MSRAINESGITFHASTPKVFLIWIFTTALCAFAIYSLWQMKAPIELFDGNRTTHLYIGLAALAGFLSLICLAVLLWEDGVALHTDIEKLSYRFLFLRNEWRWADIDRLYLDAPAAPLSASPLFGLISLGISKMLPMGKTDLRFEDIACREKKAKRLFFKPEKDGFVSLQLGFFDNPEEIFKTADGYHTAWYKRTEATRNDG